MSLDPSDWRQDDPVRNHLRERQDKRAVKAPESDQRVSEAARREAFEKAQIGLTVPEIQDVLQLATASPVDTGVAFAVHQLLARMAAEGIISINPDAPSSGESTHEDSARIAVLRDVLDRVAHSLEWWDKEGDEALPGYMGRAAQQIRSFLADDARGVNSTPSETASVSEDTARLARVIEALEGWDLVAVEKQYEKLWALVGDHADPDIRCGASNLRNANRMIASAWDAAHIPNPDNNR